MVKQETGESSDCMYSNVVAAGFIFKDGKVLLAKRAPHAKVAPSLWHLPGGHLEANESSSEALEREILEELGIKVKVGVAFDTFCYKTNNKNIRGVIHYAEVTENEKFLLDKREVTMVNWVDENEALQLLSRNCDHNIRLCTKGFHLSRSSVNFMGN